jgi:hypothetical protein
MSQYIVFDTNYIRSLPSTRDFLAGKIPETIGEQISLAIKKGDIVTIPRTVQLEINRWLETISENEIESINRAVELLQSKNFEVKAPPDHVIRRIDIVEILKSKYPEIYLLEPTLDEYLEAEKRTTGRLPPLPKNAEGEEFRDRIIWCQIVKIAESTGKHVLIVSGDKIFENGANSEEGARFNIQIAKTEDELNQWLDKIPAFIQRIMGDLLLFRSKLENIDIHLTPESIIRIEDLRAQRYEDGVTVQKFNLIASPETKLTEFSKIQIRYEGDIAVSISLNTTKERINLARDLTPNEIFLCQQSKNYIAAENRQLESELQQLLRG